MPRFLTTVAFTFIIAAVDCRAGETLGDYTPVIGTGPLTKISGQFTTTYAALYRIHISDPSAFSATTVNSATLGVDSRLYLLTLAGAGIASNDDAGDGEMRASLPPGNPLYAGLPSGDYLIGISLFDTAPYGTDGNLMFPDMTDGVNAPISTAALAAWGDDLEGNQGSYEIDFTGAAFVTGVKLDVTTTPSSGAAGIAVVNITGSGFPSGMFTPAGVSVSFSQACGGPVVLSTMASSVRLILGTSYRIGFGIPAGLAAGTYYVTIHDDDPTEINFVSSSCSQLVVDSGVSGGGNPDVRP